MESIGNLESHENLDSQIEAKINELKEKIELVQKSSEETEIEALIKPEILLNSRITTLEQYQDMVEVPFWKEVFDETNKELSIYIGAAAAGGAFSAIGSMQMALGNAQEVPVHSAVGALIVSALVYASNLFDNYNEIKSVRKMTQTQAKYILGKSE